MLDIPLSPVFGATVINERAWDRISESDQTALRESAAATQDFLFTEVPRQDREAISEMQKRGLNVSSLDEASAEKLRREAERLTATWREDRVPSAIYDVALRARNSYREK